MTHLGRPFLIVAAAAAVVGVVGIVLLATQGEGEAAPAPAPQAQVKYAQENPAPEPNLSPPAPEPETPLTNSSIEDLVGGTLDAIQREDRAWLARTMESTSNRDLTEDDLLAAYRQFLWRSAQPMWARVRAAWQAGAWRVEQDADAGRIFLDVGGALGEMRLELVKINNGWHYADT
jgi:hypothetical protein